MVFAIFADLLVAAASRPRVFACSNSSDIFFHSAALAFFFDSFPTPGNDCCPAICEVMCIIFGAVITDVSVGSVMDGRPTLTDRGTGGQRSAEIDGVEIVLGLVELVLPFLLPSAAVLVDFLSLAHCANNDVIVDACAFIFSFRDRFAARKYVVSGLLSWMVTVGAD